MADVLDKRLLFVLGKGGVGRSTVAVALGLATARRGRRTVVVEVARQGSVTRAFARHEAGFAEVELHPGLWTISIDPQRAMEEYIALQLKLKPLADLLSSSRAFGYFAAAAPGLRELVTVGKIWELAQEDRRTAGAEPYDIVIVDAPATGHGIALLSAPKTMRDIARVGPIAHQANTIHDALSDPARTGVIAVALPEDMPVSETLELRAALGGELGLDFDLVVANEVYPERFADDEVEALRRGLDDVPEPRERAALAAALSEQARAAAQREQLARLRDGTGREPILLPYVFAPGLDLEALERLSRVLEDAL